MDSFPGGEYLACYLTSLGFSYGEIKEFIKSANKVAKLNYCKSDIDIVNNVDKALENYW